MDPKPSQPSSVPEPQPSEDYVEVEFRAEALVKFNEMFTTREQRAVLDLLVEHASEGIEVEKEEDIPVRLLTLFKVRFRFLDLTDIGRLTVLSLESSTNDSPPPNHRKWQDPLISGGTAGLVRWLLGQIFGRIRPSLRIVTINGLHTRNGGVFLIARGSARTLGLRN